MTEPENVILGTAYGYTLTSVTPFLRSAAEFMPDAQVVLFMDRFSPELQSEAHRINGRCVLSYSPDSVLRRAIHSMPRGRLLLSRTLLRLAALRKRYQNRGPGVVSGAFGVAIARYLWYFKWLNFGNHANLKKLIVADTRDIVFQGDVFPLMSEDRLYCGIENARLNDCKQNRDWYLQAYGSEATKLHGSRAILCSGFTGGGVSAMSAYLQGMVEQIVLAGPRIALWNGYDQALHTMLLHETSFENRCCFQGEESALVSTMVRMRKDQFEIDSDGCVCLKNKGRICVVHQYDRHPGLVEAVRLRFSVS